MSGRRKHRGPSIHFATAKPAPRKLAGAGQRMTPDAARLKAAREKEADEWIEEVRARRKKTP